MKKIICLIMCTILLSLTLCFTASADSITLPDGGQIANSGYQTVYGRSSGGSNGYANLTCTVTTTQGVPWGKDSATAKTRSNVSTGLSASLSVSVWLTDSTSGYADASANDTFTSIPVDGITVTVKSTSSNALKALGGHGVVYDLERDSQTV